MSELVDEGSAGESRLRDAALRVLDESWRDPPGYCPPNPTVYPHLWLWDSCFHAIAWGTLGDKRGLTELTTCLDGQRASGFVPHMRYFGASENRGPLEECSSFVQPPVYAHAASVLARQGWQLTEALLARVSAGLTWLWENRRTPDGLMVVVHPWETGADDSPRWDDWIGLPTYDHRRYSEVDRRLVDSVLFDRYGAAVTSRSLVCAPASFNALTAHAASELSALTGDETWQERSEALADATDELLWDEQEGLWSDLALVGGGSSCRVPTLDGALGVLATTDAEKAHRVLGQLTDPARFGAAFGLRFVARDHPAYDPTAYWRGPAWPQLNYLLAVGAERWGDHGVRSSIREMSVAGALQSGLAEYWNPEDGTGLGAVPQGWAAVTVAIGGRG